MHLAQSGLNAGFLGLLCGCVIVKLRLQKQQERRLTSHNDNYMARTEKSEGVMEGKGKRNEKRRWELGSLSRG